MTLYHILMQFIPLVHNSITNHVFLKSNLALGLTILNSWPLKLNSDLLKNKSHFYSAVCHNP